MAMRLQELHPALVHFPIALLPTTLAVDALGRATGNPTLKEMGKWGMALSAGSAVISGVAGLLAQESSNFDDETREILVTHRNLNLGLVALTSWMAAERRKRRRPGVGYLLAGLAGVATMSYSAYLGGHMVYEHGVGVKKAGGVREGDAPHLLPENAGEVARVSTRHVERGLQDAVGTLARGGVLPWLTRGETTHVHESQTPPLAEPRH